MALQSIEKNGYKQLLQAFDPQYELLSSKYITNMAIPALYYKRRDKVVFKVRQAEFFSATTNLWSSNIMESYLSFTVHYRYLDIFS